MLCLFVHICIHLEANVHYQLIRALSDDYNQPQYSKLAYGKQMAWPQGRAGQYCWPDTAPTLTL